MTLSTATPIVKPVDGLCNLSCSYCYTSKIKNSKKCMPAETLKKVIDYFFRDQNDIEFIWHGGEPLLAGLNFYQKIVKFQYKWTQEGKK